MMRGLTGVFPDGAVALVTGGSRGIGAAAALALAQAECRVVVAYRAKADKAEKTAVRVRELGRECLTVRADVTDETQVIALFRTIREQFGRLDTAVLNSGVTADGHAAGMSLAKWDQAINEMKVLLNDTAGQVETSHQEYNAADKRGADAFQI